MASLNSALFLSLLVAISAFMAAPSYVEAQSISGLPSIIRTNGTVFCALNVTLLPNNTVPAPFPNAQVQLRCGNISVATTTTNASGGFAISLNSTLQTISSLLSGIIIGNCRVVVTTPLVACNATLPAGVGLAANVTNAVISIGSNVIRPILGVFLAITLPI